MTGTGFDGILVNREGMSTIQGTLFKMVKDIDVRMDNLERDLNPLQSDWSGDAKDAYQQAKLRWDTAIAEMVQLLSETGSTVETSQAEYAAADQRGASSFHFGR